MQSPADSLVLPPDDAARPSRHRIRNVRGQEEVWTWHGYPRWWRRDDGSIYYPGGAWKDGWRYEGAAP